MSPLHGKLLFSKIKNKWDICYIFANLLNVWLTRRQLDSHICCVQSSVLIENLISHRDVVGKGDLTDPLKKRHSGHFENHWSMLILGIFFSLLNTQFPSLPCSCADHVTWSQLAYWPWAIWLMSLGFIFTITIMLHSSECCKSVIKCTCKAPILMSGTKYTSEWYLWVIFVMMMMMIW